MVVPVARVAAALQIQAAPEVLSVIAALGRTEDLRFSPSGRLIAIAGYLKNQIAVLAVDIRSGVEGKTIVFERGVVMSSPALKKIHGLDFLDEDTIIAANRGGGVPVFRIPPLDASATTCEVQPIRELVADGVVGLDGPGSVVVSLTPGSCDVLICNNFSNTVTRHRLDTTAGYRPISTEVLLRKWFDIPDGICINHDQAWIAVSQAGCGWVCVYPNSSSLHAESAILAMTFEFQTLVFFDVAEDLERLHDASRPQTAEFVSFVPHESSAGPETIRSDRDRAALEVAYELHQLSNARNAIEAGIEGIRRTWSWRVTAPLRTLSQLVRRI